MSNPQNNNLTGSVDFNESETNLRLLQERQAARANIQYQGPSSSNNNNLTKRSNSLSRPERAKTIDRRKHSLKREFMRSNSKKGASGVKSSATEQNENKAESQKKSFPSCWVLFSYIATFYAPAPLLKAFGMKTGEIRQAWREKMALVTIIVIMCAAVGFLTFALQSVICKESDLNRIAASNGISSDSVVINGKVYRVSTFEHPQVDGFTQGGSVTSSPFPNAGGKDISLLFQDINSNCKSIFQTNTNYFPCVVSLDDSPKLSDPSQNQCHKVSSTKKLKLVGDLYYTWDEIRKNKDKFVVYNGQVLNMERLNYVLDGVTTSSSLKAFGNSTSIKGTDVSYLLANNDPTMGSCLGRVLRAGVIDTKSIGCFSSDIILYVSLIVIVGVILVKFFMAIFFNWVLSNKLGSLQKETPEQKRQRREEIEKWSDDYYRGAPVVASKARFSTNFISPPNQKRNSFFPQKSRFSNYRPSSGLRGKKQQSNLAKSNYTNSIISSRIQENDVNGSDGSHVSQKQTGIIKYPSPHVAPAPPPESFQPYDFSLAHTLLLVTCYSEDEQGLRTTFDSLAVTDYPSSHKLLFVVCDGIITGSGNSMSTPDTCLSMMKDFVIEPEEVQAYSYVAIADGEKRHNMARIYAGYYKYDDNLVDKSLQVRMPMILVVKCGSESERAKPKAGNRGKRDGQIILMGFLQRIMFDDRLSELDFAMFNAIWNITGVTPDSYEIVLMVDADTKVYPDSLTKMVSVMVKDPQVMGLCGETKIANKSESWVSMIQVFEYYISHHSAKAFEAVFGGVTCLPGCFCMYRIKSPKGPNGNMVPIIASPDIVENYSENVVDTLHKKNLLLLGEDRYLTTLMLKTFPKRKMIFVPQAVCKTIVPAEFKVLLSQRRRWINSTVHNLLELVLIRDLCGTFCFSMQFVIFMELVGTVVLPAAITFTFYLIIISFITKPVPIMPLILLAIVLGLPAVLILFTTRKLVYIGWMLIYLCALPIWNFVLPVYAYWHFDDFSWGQTRMVDGETPGEDHGKKEGEFDSSHIKMKKWVDFEREKRSEARRILKDIYNEEDDYCKKSIYKLGYLSPYAFENISANVANEEL